MSCPKPRQWDLLSMQVLEEPQVAELQVHLRQCDRCRHRFEQACREHAELAGTSDAFGAEHDRLREQLMAALPDELPRPERAGPVRAGFVRFGDFVMSLNTEKSRRAAWFLAPAACVALIVFLFVGPSTARVFAGAIQRFREAETIVCKVTIRMVAKLRQADGTPFETQEFNRTEELYMSASGGVRRDSYEGDELVSTTYDPAGGPVVVLDHRNETYTDFSAVEQSEAAKEIEDRLRDGAAERALPELHFFGLSHDPDRLIKGLRQLTVEADRELGYAEIEGYEAVGFEISGEKIGFAPPVAEPAKENRAELWVGVEDDLPLKLVMHFATEVKQMKDLPISASFEMSATYDHFEFDVPLDPQWFEPQIPEWFKPAEEVDQPLAEAPTEESFIQALELFAELAGRYPATLQPTNIGFEVSYLMGSLQAKHNIAKRRGDSTDDLPDLKEVGAKVQALIFFAVLQADGRNPQYVGETVEPGDAEAVLLKWTIEDGGTRVIYGNLEAETLP